MTFGFFSSRGRFFCFVSAFILHAAVYAVAKNAVADSPELSSEDTNTPQTTDGAGDDDAFFDNIDLETLEDEGYESTVVDRRFRVTDETSGFAETIDLRDTPERMTSAADVLAAVGGVQVRRTGGIGSSASLGIRGSTSRQVPILLDGIEISGNGTSAVDLGDLPLDLFDSMEVYRGSAPVSLGASGIGGALCLRTIPLTRPFTRATGSIGSFGTRRLSVGHGTPIGDFSGLAVFTALHTDGDFPYLNRNGTRPYDKDDKIDLRANNAMTSYGALLKVGGPLKKWNWQVSEVLFDKIAGVPGVESVQTKAATDARMRNQIAGTWSGPLSKRADAALTAGFTYTADDFRDPLQEFGVQSQSDTDSLIPSVYLARTRAVPTDGSLRLTWERAGISDISLSNRFEQLHRDEYGDGKHVDLSGVLHDRLALGIGQRWQPFDMLALDPALRFYMDYSHVEAPEAQIRTDTFWSPSFGVKLTPVSNLTLRASVGRYVRMPDLDERYGAFGAIVGNPSLSSETAVNGDAGVSVDVAALGYLRIRAQAAWFCSFAKDLIVYDQNSQHTIRPENVGRAVIQGAETGIRLHLKEVLAFELAYTYLYAVNRSEYEYYYGKRLPGRPAHRAYGKIELGGGGEPFGGRIWLDLDVAGQTYLNRYNQPEYETPASCFLGFGYRLSHPKSGTSLTFEVRNVLNQMTAETREGLDAPVSDFLGFPLPGRQLFLTFAWKG